MQNCTSVPLVDPPDHNQLHEGAEMSEEKLKQPEPSTEKGNDYQAPSIEEVVTREGVEREVAYAGVSSIIIN